MPLVTIEDDPRKVTLRPPPGAEDVHGMKQAVERAMEIVNSDHPDDRVKLGYYMLEAWRAVCENMEKPFDWQWGLVIAIRKGRERGMRLEARPYFDRRTGKTGLPVAWVATVAEAYLDWLGMPEPPYHFVSDEGVHRFLRDTDPTDGAAAFFLDDLHRKE